MFALGREPSPPPPRGTLSTQAGLFLRTLQGPPELPQRHPDCVIAGCGCLVSACSLSEPPLIL